MDACNEKGINTVVLMKSAQVGYTEILLNILGYFISQDPSPILMVQPTLEMAETFSKTRLAPMLRDTPALAGKISESRSKDSANTLLAKSFSGGHFALAGANSPSGLASRPIRVVMCDEVDRFPPSAGAEGDPISLAIKRTTTFRNRVIVIGSTPTVKGTSRIEMAFANSDQRNYFVPCPHCGAMQVLKWANVQWQEGQPHDAYMVCGECGAVIQERDKPAMLAKGEWRATEPATRGIAGFHISELYSPWRRWGEVATDFLIAKRSAETLKTWVNTSLGECWEEEAEKSDPESLYARRENYSADLLPDKILYLTAGVDVQDDRLEMEVVGWRQSARDEPPESWGIEYKVFRGDPAKTGVWDSLDAALQYRYNTESGRPLRIQACCIDSGGHHTSQVYAFCAERAGRHIYATRGMEGAKPIWTPKARKSRKYNAQYFSVGADSAKDAWYSRLRIAEPGPGYCHFPIDYDMNYFNGLTSEQVRTKYVKGRPVREWFLPSGRRNEPLDIRGLALAALLSRPIDWLSLATARPIREPTVAPKSKPRNNVGGGFGGGFINRPIGGFIR